MADITGIDPTTGQPITVPQEAAATEYRAGRLKFNDADRIPVTIGGQDGTVPASDLDRALNEYGAEFNFDPHGSLKAGLAGAARGATMGLSDWAAVEGSKLLGGHEAGEKTRKILEGLREERPYASGVGELGGAIIPALIPGGAETMAAREAAEGGALTARAATAAESAIAPAVVAQTTKAGLETAQAATAAKAATEAARGTTLGSPLARALRATNPYEYVGRAGAGVANLIGEGRAAGMVAPLVRYATEGAIIGAAGAADEAELGDIDLTADAFLAGAEHGALWGTGLGLVGAGATRIITGAGRMAERLAQAQLGGSMGEIRRSVGRFGAGAIGRRILEEGGLLKDGESRYEWAESLHERDGQRLAQIVKDADPEANGVKAADVIGAAKKAIDQKAEAISLAGGDGQKWAQKLMTEVQAGMKWRNLEPPPVTPGEADVMDAVDEAWRRAGRPPVNEIRRPRKPKDGLVEQRAQELIAADGLTAPITIRDVALRKQALSEDWKLRAAAADELGAPRPPQPDLSKIPGQLEAERAEKIAQLREQADKEIMQLWREAQQKFDSLNDEHARLVESVRTQKMEEASRAAAEYDMVARATQRDNANLRVGFEQARAVRQKIDAVIPWNYAHNADAMMNAAHEMKLAVRQAIEDEVERGFDARAQEIGDLNLLAKYTAAKRDYAISAEIARMAERGRARHLAHFGKPNMFTGGSEMMLGAATGALLGHPIAGGALGLAATAGMKHFAPKAAAWLLYKASKLAALKATRQEVLIGMRRGIREAITGESQTFAAQAEEAATSGGTISAASELVGDLKRFAPESLHEWLDRKPVELQPHTFTDEPGNPIMTYTYTPDDPNVTPVIRIDRQRLSDYWGKVSSLPADSRGAPGTMWSVGEWAKSPEELERILALHELGHHVHVNVPNGDLMLRTALAQGKDRAISRYGATNRHEYFAESFAAYHTAPEQLRAHDPVGYQLVEAISGGTSKAVSDAAERIRAKLQAKYAKVTAPDAPPHELRMSAATDMTKVVELATSQTSRLGYYDSALSLVAPKTYQAASGGLRRGLTYLASQVPPRHFATLQRGQELDPKDIRDEEARNFYEAAAVVADPRVATDALARGQATPTQAAALKAAWPPMAAYVRATIDRERRADKRAWEYMPVTKKAQLEMFSGEPAPGPAFTLMLQSNAQALSQFNLSGKRGQPTGMQHASATSKGMSAAQQKALMGDVAMLHTTSQVSESGAPGRRQHARGSQ